MPSTPSCYLLFHKLYHNMIVDGFGFRVNPWSPCVLLCSVIDLDIYQKHTDQPNLVVLTQRGGRRVGNLGFVHIRHVQFTCLPPQINQI